MGDDTRGAAPLGPASGVQGTGNDPSQGEELPFIGGRVLISHRETRGEYCLLEASAPPDDETPAHVHRHDDETFYVLRGALELRVGDVITRLEAGDSAVAPRGIAHAWTVVSDVPARWLNVSNGGLEDFARAAGRPAGRPIEEIGLKHGIELL